jgi:4-hydroxybenzoate polyprenyltransferase
MKNVFVFAPIFFSNNLLYIGYILQTTTIFFSFCFASSAVYCLNDIIDAENDRKHPVKCQRPVASRRVSVKSAYSLMAGCLLLSFGSLFFSKHLHDRNSTTAIIATYLLINIAYCLKLKQKAVADVFIIALGFVLRVLSGSTGTGIDASAWLILMTFLVALFLALAKRRDDFRLYSKTGLKPRMSITGYNAQFIDLAITIVATVTLVCYIMYTMSEQVVERFGSNYVYLTSIFVLIGILRYLQNMLVYECSRSPTKIFIQDYYIQLCIAAWLLSFLARIYL